MSSQEKNKQGKIVGIIVGAIVFGLVSYGVKSFFKKDITTEMKKVVKEMNASTPTVIDEYTRLDSVALTAKTKFEYYYTVKGMNTSVNDLDEVRKTIKSSIISGLKGSPDMEPFRKNSITLGYNYFNEQGELLFDIVAAPSDYK